MPKYGYNFPWSGRLGRIAKRCHYCGDSGASFALSSRANRCCQCKGGDVPIPEIAQQTERDYERLARKWCDEKGIDYDKTVANYYEHLGPPLQERDGPIPNADKDYTVYK